MKDKITMLANEANDNSNQYPLLFWIFTNYMIKLESGEDDAASVGSSVLPEEA